MQSKQDEKGNWARVGGACKRKEERKRKNCSYNGQRERLSYNMCKCSAHKQKREDIGWPVLDKTCNWAHAPLPSQKDRKKKENK